MNHDHEQNWWYEHLPEEPGEKAEPVDPETTVKPVPGEKARDG